MRAAKMKERPSFQLMVQTDVQSIYHMQMPRWLFSDPRYCEMSLDAKVTYTFLLNRFQLSRRNGWVNERGEVFVIFPRKALAKELRICEQRVTAAFKKLVELELVWEKRCGRGDANQIYLAYVTPQDDPNYDDVYQQLALRLIKAVAGYDPEKGRLEQHIFAQLKYELLSCKSAYRLCGMTGAPHSFRKSHIISIDTLSENSGLYEETLAA